MLNEKPFQFWKGFFSKFVFLLKEHNELRIIIWNAWRRRTVFYCSCNNHDVWF